MKKAPRTWYARLDKYIQQQGFKIGVANNNIYIKVEEDEMIIIVVYADDIIFGSNNDYLSKIFSKSMQNEFEISMLEESSFFGD